MEAKITVTGEVPLSQKDAKLKQIWDLCDEEHVGIPPQVVKHFKGTRPVLNETLVEIPHEYWDETDHLQIVSIDVIDIPKKVTFLEIKVTK